MARRPDSFTRLLPALAVALCSSFAHGEPEPVPVPDSPASVDPLAAKTHIDPLGAFRVAQNTPPAAPTPAPAPVAAPPPSGVDTVPPGGSCASDAQCIGRAYCDRGTCVELRHRTSALLYYHQPGPDGYRVLVPFYWHFWDREARTQIVFPVYFRHDNKTEQSSDIVLPLLLFQHHTEPGFAADRVWPIFFWHRYGEDARDGSAVGLLPIFWAGRNKTRQTGIAPLLLSGWSRDTATGDFRALVLGLFYWQRQEKKSFGVVFPLVWHAGDPESSTTVIVPIGLLHTDKARRISHGTIVPLFHYRSEDDGRRRLFISPLFAYSQNEDEKTHQFIGFAPPIYHRRDPKREVDVVFPLALRWRDKADRTTTTLIGPYLRREDPQGVTDSLLPLFWRFKDKETGGNTVLFIPLLAWHDSPGVKARLVGPFWDYRGPSGWSRGMFPILFFQNLDGREHQVVLPLFLHTRDKSKQADTWAGGPVYFHRDHDGWDAGFVPLVFFGRHLDPANAIHRHVGGDGPGSVSDHYTETPWSSYAVVGPYVYRGNVHGGTHVLGPLYASRRDDGYAYGLAPLIHFGKSDGGHLRWIVPPIYFHFDDPKAKTSFTMIGPAFDSREDKSVTRGFFPIAWSVDRPPRYWRVLFPIFGTFRDEERKTEKLWVGPYVRLRDQRLDATTHVLFPFVVKHDAPDYHVLVQFPFFWRIQEGQETDTVVFPFYGRIRKPGWKVDVAFPLVWRFAGDEGATTVVGPAYLRTKKVPGGERTDAGLFPLAGYGSEPGKRYAWSILAFWHGADDKAGTNRTIAGPFLWDRTPTGWTSALFPLWVAWHRGSTTRFFAPLFYRSNDTEKGISLNVIGPFYYGSDPHGRSSGLIPLVFARTHDDGRWSATVLPIFHAAKKADGIRILTPIFGLSTYQTGQKGFVGPVYWRKEALGYTASVIPIFWHSVDTLTGDSTTAVVPFYFRKASTEKSLTGITPLIWRYETVESSTTVAFPLVFDQHYYQESRTTGVLPFYIRHKNWPEKAETHVIPPLLLYLKVAPEGTDFVLFPLVWRLVNKAHDRTSVVFPLFWDFRRGNATTQVLFPIYVRATRETADYTIVLNMYYKRGKGENAGSYYVNIFPLFDFGRPRPQDLEWNIFGGAVGYARIGRTRTLKILWAVEVPLQPATLSAAPTGHFFSATPSSMRRDLF